MDDTLIPPCEDLLSTTYRQLWCGDTDPTGRYVCRRVWNHRADRHVGRNNAGGIHQWPAAATAPAPATIVYGVAPDDLHHDDVVTAQRLWEAIKPQFDPNDAWEFTEIGPLLRTFIAVLDQRRDEIAAAAGIDDLRQQIVLALDGQVTDFIMPNEFGGYDVAYGQAADIALAVVQPVLEQQAADIAALRRRKQADLDELKRRLGLAGRTLTAHCKRRDEQDAEIARLRTTNESLLAMLERMETLHVTWYGPDGEEVHPEWCRECRVDKVRAELADLERQRDDWWNQRAAERDRLAGLLRGMARRAGILRRERNLARSSRDQYRRNWDRCREANRTALQTISALKLDRVALSGLLRGMARRASGQRRSKERLAMWAESRPAAPADGAASFGQSCEEQGRIPAGRYYLTIGVEVGDNREVVSRFDVPGGVNIRGFWQPNKTRIEPAPPVGSDTTADGGSEA